MARYNFRGNFNAETPGIQDPQTGYYPLDFQLTGPDGVIPIQNGVWQHSFKADQDQFEIYVHWAGALNRYLNDMSVTFPSGSPFSVADTRHLQGLNWQGHLATASGAFSSNAFYTVVNTGSFEVVMTVICGLQQSSQKGDPGTLAFRCDPQMRVDP